MINRLFGCWLWGSLLTSSLTAAPILYGITFDEELIRINTTTGAGTLVGNLSSTMASFGLGTRNNELYTFDQTADLIRQLSPTTAATLNSFNVGITTVGEGGLAFRSDGLGFLSQGGGGGFWSFSLSTLTSSLITSVQAPTMDGLDFSPTDVLYGLSQETYNLYTINVATGATTLIGATGLTAATGFGGLAFRGDGVLFAIQGLDLYTINTATGVATLIGNSGFDKISGLTFLDVEASSVPEPGSAMLLVCGAALLLVIGKRKF